MWLCESLSQLVNFHLCVPQGDFFGPYRLDPISDIVTTHAGAHSVQAHVENRFTVSLFETLECKPAFEEYEIVHKRHVQYRLNADLLKPITTAARLSQQCKQPR